MLVQVNLYHFFKMIKTEGSQWWVMWRVNNNNNDKKLPKQSVFSMRVLPSTALPQLVISTHRHHPAPSDRWEIGRGHTFGVSCERAQGLVPLGLQVPNIENTNVPATGTTHTSKIILYLPKKSSRARQAVWELVQSFNIHSNGGSKGFWEHQNHPNQPSIKSLCAKAHQGPSVPISKRWREIKPNPTLNPAKDWELVF